jgi:hypothetical protein
MRYLVAAALLALAGCSATSPSPGTPLARPSGSLQVGVHYAYRLETHCGLRPIELDGGVWTFQDVISDSSGNPPSGFGNPWDDGTLTLLDHDHALFRSSHGVERKLTRGGVMPSELCA